MTCNEALIMSGETAVAVFELAARTAGAQVVAADIAVFRRQLTGRRCGFTGADLFARHFVFAGIRVDMAGAQLRRIGNSGAVQFTDRPSDGHRDPRL